MLCVSPLLLIVFVVVPIEFKFLNSARVKLTDGYFLKMRWARLKDIKYKYYNTLRSWSI